MIKQEEEEFQSSEPSKRGLLCAKPSSVGIGAGRRTLITPPPPPLRSSTTRGEARRQLGENNCIKKVKLINKAVNYLARKLGEPGKRKQYPP